METQAVSSGTTSTTSSETTQLVSDEYLGKEDFLELLVAQLQYQDPLNPLEDSEFVAQLAQFSSLEQLQNMNETLSDSVDWDMIMSQTISNTMATSLIGKEVVAGNTTLVLGEEGSTNIVFDTADYVQSGTVTIYDADGTAVRTLSADNLAAGEQQLTWDGNDDNGTRMDAGYYYFETELYGTDGATVESQGYVIGTVDGIKYVDGSAYLDVDGALVPLSDVMEINDQG